MSKVWEKTLKYYMDIQKKIPNPLIMLIREFILWQIFCRNVHFLLIYALMEKYADPWKSF
jgi:hypothetical protein